MDKWDLIKQLTKNHGYSIKLAIPLVHQTMKKLRVRELTQDKATEVIAHILIYDPILSHERTAL